MPGLIGLRSRRVLLGLGVLALAVAGCSSSSPAASPAASGAAQATQQAGTSANAAATSPVAAKTAAPGNGGSGLGGAAANLSKITSYKFKMTMKGGSYGSLLGSAPITGTVVTSPKKAAQMSAMGMDIVEVEGKTYVKMGSTWIAGDDSSSSMADSFAPEKMFGSSLSGAAADGYKAVGQETKNGVATVHYQADASVLNAYGSLFGVKGTATWSADAWVAKDGGYPVSMAVKASGGDAAFEMTFDITNINDPSNKVEVPQDVSSLG